jgi:hypothetical protein
MNKIVSVLMMLLISVFGCATHDSIKTPDLVSNPDCLAEKQVKNDVEIMMMAIHDKQSLKSYFDEDLIALGVLPVKVSIDNIGENPCFIGVEYAHIADPHDAKSAAMTLEEVYNRTSKSYWRTAGWGVAFGLLGALPSAVNVASTNQKIKADYDTCMLKDGRLPAKTHTDGTLFFEIDEKVASLDDWTFKIGIDRDGEPFYFIFDLHGQVEQPRIKKVTDNEKDMK